VTCINIASSNHDSACFIEEAKSVDSVRRLRSLSHQEERHFTQDGSLDLLPALSMPARQNSHHGVNRMALHLFNSVAELVHDH